MAVSARETRLIEVRFTLTQIKKILDPEIYSPETPLVGHDEADSVRAFLRTLSWKKGSRSDLVTQAIFEVMNAVGEAEFNPAPFFELAKILEEGVPQDVDFSPPKPKKEE